MKQYLKMVDIFIVGAVTSEHVISLCDDCLAGHWSSEIPNQYAAHAINSHDELVQMNRELLAALEDLWSDVEYAYDGFRGARISADKVVEIISKAKGGEA